MPSPGLKLLLDRIGLHMNAIGRKSDDTHFIARVLGFERLVGQGNARNLDLLIGPNDATGSVRNPMILNARSRHREDQSGAA